MSTLLLQLIKTLTNVTEGSKDHNSNLDLEIISESTKSAARYPYKNNEEVQKFMTY